MPKMSRILITILFCFLIIFPQIANAEWFTDLYFGGAWTSDGDIKLKSPGPSNSMKEDFESSVEIGYRVGHWFNAFPYLGLALDGSIFSADPDFELDNDGSLLLVPISALVMGRIPILRDHDFPMGKFQLYGGVGPGLFYSKVDVDDALIINTPIGIVTEDFSDWSFDIGLDSRLGLAWMFYKSLALQLEFRYTYVEPEYSDRVLGDKFKYEVEVETYHSLIGLSYRF
jgi:opacity protein-like surface antigen